MTTKLLRGRTLSFLRTPYDVNDHGSYRFEMDGALLIKDGVITAVGPYVQVKAALSEAVEEIDHRPYLIMPGFVDLHIHFPQTQMIASYAPDLLGWLNTYTFPAELGFSEAAHCQQIASAFCDELVNNGTTTAAAYCSVHPGSVDALMAEAARRNMLMIAGKVMMDRNAPEGLLDTAETSYRDTTALIRRWHGAGRGRIAITPRFAITSTPAQLEAAGLLVKEWPDLHIQTHLSENRDEIRYSCELYPGARDYTDIYANYGLLHSKTLLGHCIYLSERERDVLSETGAVAVHCPTSNLFLGSGLFPLEELSRRSRAVRTGVATDVGAGTSFSMLRTMDEAYKIQQLLGARLNPLKSFHDMTLGNAVCLGCNDRIGTLAVGGDADLVVLDSSATSLMALRMAKVSSLAEELFMLQTLGDDRAVVETYIAGNASKSSRSRPESRSAQESLEARPC
ncbi:Guanine deaminase [Agrobacterium sp. DSM 25558]|uniref:guanine deaminase n=1 Tax=Agrobacterium sp. DSM 25558 TaxID=1907665 RepID=UPI0009724FCA|nr:guanine deaminase [Agrobacterium sp. DSM 25558]SCX30120.1 Guanine deaminase [Agrobacterium sp. DSM 25558]